MTDTPVETEVADDPEVAAAQFTPEQAAILRDSTVTCYDAFTKCANAAQAMGGGRLSKADFMLVVEEAHIVIDAAIDAMDAIIPDEVP